MRRRMWVVPVIILAILTFAIPSMAEDEVDSLQAALKKVLPETSLSAESSAWKAVDRLSKIGSSHAIEVLQRVLTTYGANRQLKRRALLALAHIGTSESISAIGRFEAWTVQLSQNHPAFRFGPRALPMDHFSCIDVRPLATCTDGDGVQWAVFFWHRFGARRLWITSSRGNDQWTTPVWLNVDWAAKIPDDSAAKLRIEDDQFVLPAEGKEFRFRLQTYIHDGDHDGLPDELEQLLGTNPKKPDTDGDTLADGMDGNPLAGGTDTGDSLSQIRQAAFSYLFNTSDALDAIVVVQNGDFAYQQYQGYGGALLKSYKIRQGFFNLTRMSARKESPTAASVIIEDWEGGLAGSCRTLKLARIHDKWVVIGETMMGVA